MSNQTASGNRFIPTNPCQRGILGLFSDEKSADVVFEFDGQEKFHAHRLILKACAPALAELCDDTEETASVPITGVQPEIFRHLLYYVYGGTVPDEAFSKSSKEIIEAANKFGIGALKVEAEGWYVESNPITMDDFVDHLHFSDTRMCALLKEKVMDFVVENKQGVLRKLRKSEDPQSETMLTDILAALIRKKPGENENLDKDEYDAMDVTTLRKELDSNGLNVDGTHKMLVIAIENHQGAISAIVEGAGIPEINGRYIRAGSYNEAPVYKKSTKHRGENVDLVLYRYEDDSAWYISSLPAGIKVVEELLCSGSEVDFYYAYETENEKIPPEHGWQAAHSRAAASPAPNVFLRTTA